MNLARANDLTLSVFDEILDAPFRIGGGNWNSHDAENPDADSHRNAALGVFRLFIVDLLVDVVENGLNGSGACSHLEVDDITRVRRQLRKVGGLETTDF